MKQQAGKMIALLLVCSCKQANAQKKPVETKIGKPELGVNVSLKGRQIFPSSDLWNRDISRDFVDPRSAAPNQTVAATLLLPLPKRLNLPPS